MKKVQVLKAEQKDIKFFILAYDPRQIIKLVEIPKKDTDQDSQRPWKESRVLEISKYVAGLLNISDNLDKKKAKGYIPNCPILNILPPIEIEKTNDQYYIALPETEEEFIECAGKAQILDGQHRLIAFSDEYRDQGFKDEENYEMGFVIFDELTLSEKREIFMVTNDKQEKVEPNVLNQIKQWLGLLSEEEKNTYNLIVKLNTEQISPLKNRFVIGGHKVKNGLKLNQASKIILKSGIYDLLAKLDEDQQIKTITNYLSAWEKVYNGKFNNPKHILGKISGLRYVFYLFPSVFEILKEKNKHFKREEVEPIVNSLFVMTDGEKLFIDNPHFRQEGLTIKLARTHGSSLKETVLENEGFNPAIF